MERGRNDRHAPAVFGLHLDAHSVRLVRLVAGPPVTLTGVATRPLPVGTSQGGAVRDVQIVGCLVAGLARELLLDSAPVALACEGADVAAERCPDLAATDPVAQKMAGRAAVLTDDGPDEWRWTPTRLPGGELAVAGALASTLQRATALLDAAGHPGVIDAAPLARLRVGPATATASPSPPSSERHGESVTATAPATGRPGECVTWTAPHTGRAGSVRCPTPISRRLEPAAVGALTSAVGAALGLLGPAPALDLRAATGRIALPGTRRPGDGAWNCTPAGLAVVAHVPPGAPPAPASKASAPRAPEVIPGTYPEVAVPPADVVALPPTRASVRAHRQRAIGAGAAVAAATAAASVAAAVTL